MGETDCGTVGVHWWKCTEYAGLSCDEQQAPVPIGLRCWSNEVPNTVIVYNRCKTNNTSMKYDGWSNGTGDDLYLLSGKPLYNYQTYTCTNHRDKDCSISLDQHPVESDTTIATTQQIEQIRSAINTEITLRQGNPTYQNGNISKTPSLSTNSEFLPNLPSSPSGSPANNTITSNMLMYKQLLETLEDYIKLADKEKSINLSGNGPSLSTIDFADTNIIQASDENTLSAIYAETYQDCVCYTDCNGYAVCWCYGNCHNY